MNTPENEWIEEFWYLASNWRLSQTPENIALDSKNLISFIKKLRTAAYHRGQEDEAIAHTKKDMDAYKAGQEDMKRKAIECVRLNDETKYPSRKRLMDAIQALKTDPNHLQDR